ncbi:MAG TPA: carboxypeptidase regulatory-like domain-containing protein [Candidatus Acidoferrum sp.]|nr:carboxypeptidase regulatory-like domain-containing protein [Candidatus Acidoferrum sp.]
MRRALFFIGLFLLALSVCEANASPSPATYRIAGVIVDSVTGQPLDGAEVTLAPVTSLEDVQTFVSASDGRFFFNGLAPGKYGLAASRRGYASQGFEQHERYWTGVVVGPGLDTGHLRFRLAASSVLTGVVTDEWGDPVRDGSVMLFQQSMFEGSRNLHNISETSTDDQGRYRFAHLLAGTYVVAVHATPWFAQSQMQTFVRSGSVDGMAESFTVDGVIDGGSSTQIPSPGANPLFDLVYPVTYFPNATRLADAARVFLTPGATQLADFRLRTVPSIHIRVRAPVEPASASVTQEDGGEGTSIQIDSSTSVDLALRVGDSTIDQLQPSRTEIAPGLFELSGIPPGEFNLTSSTFSGAADGSYVSRTQSLSLLGDTDVDLHPHGALATVSGVVLFNAPSSAALGLVSPARPQPEPADADETISNFTLTLRSLKSGDSYDAAISRNGEFSFAGSTLPPGLYEVEIGAQEGLRVGTVEATGAVVSGRTVEVPADRPVKLIVHTAQAKATLSGFALKNGKPVSGAMVLLVPQDPGRGTSLYHRDQSDSDGSFTMAPLFPGRYTLLAIENGWDLEWSDPAVLFRYLPGGTPVEIPADGSVTCNAKVQ